MLSLKIIFSTLNHWKLTPNSPFKYHYNVKFSKFTKCFLCIYIQLFLVRLQNLLRLKYSPTFFMPPLKKVVGGQMLCIYLLIILSVGWPVCTVSVACSIYFYPFPERYLIGTMVSSGEWMIPEEFEVMCSKVNVKLLYLIPSVVSSIY